MMKRSLVLFVAAAAIELAVAAPVQADLVVISSESQSSTSHAEYATQFGDSAFVSSDGPTSTDESIPLSTSSSVSVGPAQFTGGTASASTSGAAPAPALNVSGKLELSGSGFAQAIAQYGQRQTDTVLIYTNAISHAQTTGSYSFELAQATTGSITMSLTAPDIFTHVTLSGPNGFHVEASPGFSSMPDVSFPQGAYSISYNAFSRAVADSTTTFVQVQAGYSFRIELASVPEAGSVLLLGAVGLCLAACRLWRLKVVDAHVGE